MRFICYYLFFCIKNVIWFYRASYCIIMCRNDDWHILCHLLNKLIYLIFQKKIVK